MASHSPPIPVHKSRIFNCFATLFLSALSGFAAEPDLPEGVQRLDNGKFQLGMVTFDSKRRTLSFPASVNMREGPIEYVLVTERGKTHEAVLITKIDPSEIHVVALLLGMKPEPAMKVDETVSRRERKGGVRIWIEWDRNGGQTKLELSQLVSVINPATGKTQEDGAEGNWLYNGSGLRGGMFQATTSGSVISINDDATALVNYLGETRDNDDIHTPNTIALPKLGFPVRVVMQVGF